MRKENKNNVMSGRMMFASAMLFMLLFAGVANAAIVATDNPLIGVGLSTYDPIPAEPGKTIDVWINIQNRGDADAKNVRVEFVDTSVFSLVSEDDRAFIIPVIGAHSDYTVKYKVIVADNAPEGENNLLIKYSAGSNLEVTERIAIDVKSAETPISINSARITPSQLSPGGKATLVLEIENIARSSNIRNVDVALQLATITSGTTTVLDLPFVTVNSGNEQTIDRIVPGQSAEFKFDIAAYPDAEAKIYKLPVTISYYDDTGVLYEKAILVGVEVNAAPDLLVTLESTDLNINVDSGNVLFNVINKGTTNVKLMTFSLEDTDSYDVISPSSELYLGNVESDDFQTARFNVKLSDDAADKGAVDFVVKLTYKDSLNNEFSEKYNVEYSLREPLVQKKGSFTWILILAIIIIGAIIWYRRRNKRRSN